MDLRGSLLVILVIRGDFISGGSHGFAWIFYYANKILAIRGGYLCFDTLG